MRRGDKKKIEKNRKKVKKVLDKSRTVCYYIGALEARTSKAKKLQKNFKKVKKVLDKNEIM